MNREIIYSLIDEKFEEYEDLVKKYAAAYSQGNLSNMINKMNELLNIENTVDLFIDPIREEKIKSELLKLTEKEYEEKEEEIREYWYFLSTTEILDRLTEDELQEYIQYVDSLKGELIERVSDTYNYDEENNFFVKI